MKNICIGCGLCSDGTMYSYVEIAASDDLVPLTAAGAVFAPSNGGTSFLLPCPAFRDGCCSIYDSRPSVCREYRCFLLRRYEAGEVGFDEAEALIRRTMALRDSVRSALTALVDPREPCSMSELYRRLDGVLEASQDPSRFRRDRAELLLDVAALRVVLAREFEPRESAGAMKGGTPPPEQDGRKRVD